MAVIGFSDKPEENWVVAGWAFRQLLDDVMKQYPHDLEMAERFLEADATGSLNMEFVAPALVKRATAALASVASGILSGEIRSGIMGRDEVTIQEYFRGLRQLLDALPKSPQADEL